MGGDISYICMSVPVLPGQLFTRVHSKNSSKASRAAQQLMQQPIYPGHKWDRVFKNCS